MLFELLMVNLDLFENIICGRYDVELDVVLFIVICIFGDVV